MLLPLWPAVSGYLSTVGAQTLAALVAVDKLACALLTGRRDETISSALAIARRGFYGPCWQSVTAPIRWLVDLVARVVFGQMRHCESSVEPDDEGAPRR